MDSVTFYYSVLSWWAFGILWADAPAPESLQGPEPYDVPALRLAGFSFMSALIDQMNIKMTQSLHVSYKATVLAPVNEYHPGIEMTTGPTEPKEENVNPSRLNLS